MKTVFIKLTKAGPTSGPFDIYDQANNVIDTDVSKKDLVAGVAFILNDSVIAIRIVSTGDCQYEKIVMVGGITQQQWMETEYNEMKTGCIWRHLTNVQLYNSFYGKIAPYIIEHSFAFKFQDEIIQNIKEYSKVYKYLPNTTGVFDYNSKVETNDDYFNQLIIYNGQQCSGTLNLFPKPLHNMKVYMEYPRFHSDGKDITFTKSDNFYNINTFWSLNKSSQVPSFVNSCESLSIDKVINNDNMDYSMRSFQKSQIRAKDSKLRFILNDKSDIHIVSNFIVVPSQISYK